MWDLSNGCVRILTVLVLVALYGCTEETSRWFVDAGTDIDAGVGIDIADEPPSANTPVAGTFRTLGHFEGFADPENGIFEIWMVEPDYSDGEYATAEQPLWCNMAVGEDDNPLTNPPNTVQLMTEDESVHATGSACRADKVEGDVSTGTVGVVDSYHDLGVFCANVTMTSFLDDDELLVAEIERHTGDDNQHAHSTATGGNAEAVDFGVQANRPRAGLGMWVYGPLAPGGSRTMQWQFKNGSAVAYQFFGRVVARRDDCEYDEDCDGVFEGCFLGGEGDDCESHHDCDSEICSPENTCEAPCNPGEFGPDCEPCPSACGGPGHGQCNDGGAGDGTCTCESGFHGSTCEHSCSDQVLNGSETRVDCGGPCTGYPEACNSIDDDCDRNIDEGTTCGAPYPVSTWNGHGYVHLKSADGWFAQLTTCRSFGYHLVVIDDSAEDRWVDAFTNGGEFWTGAASSGGPWTWAASTATLSYTNWQDGHPIGGTQCGVNSATGGWYSANCTMPLPGVCESPPIVAGMPDTDGDEIPNASDPCPNDANNDGDRDGVCGDVDLCPDVPDPLQTDSDGDLIGDACDACETQDIHACIDGDAVCPCTCDRFMDSDCTNTCGNNIIEGEENCDGSGSHPTACPRGEGGCDDGDPCTMDIYVDGGANPDDYETPSRACYERCLHPLIPELCDSNTDPGVATNGGLVAAEGGSAFFGTPSLQVTDPDSADTTQIVYTIETLPPNGDVFNGGLELDAGDTFTQSEVDAGDVLYVHDGSETTVDWFRVTVSDSNGGGVMLSPILLTITPVNDAPTGNAQAVSVTQDVAKAITLTASDPDTAPEDLTYSIALGPDHGVLSGTPPNSTYTPDLNYIGADSFTFEVDDGALTDTAVVSVTVGLPAAVTVNDVTVVEGTGMLFTVTLDAATAGAFSVNVTLTDVTATGGADPLIPPIDYDSIVGALAFSGTLGETQQFTVNTLDDATVEGTESFVVTIDATDPAVTDSDSGTGTITDNDVANSPPTASDVTVVATEDVNYGFESSDFAYSDADADSFTQIQITSLESVGELKVSGADVGLFGVISIGDINAGNLTFTPDIDDNGAGYDSFSFKVHDGTEFSTDSYTMTIDVTAVNDPATGTNLGAAESYTEDVSLDLINIVASDVDGAVVTATLTLSDLVAGTLNTGTSGAVTSTWNPVTAQWSASGAISDVNSLLAGVTFTPAMNYSSTFNINTSVSDAGGPADTGVKVMTGTAVNDGPTPTNMNTSEAYTEDVPLNLINIVVSDVDSASVTASLTLSDANVGSLSTATSGSVTSTFVAGLWSASGALFDVNVLLSGVTFTPAPDVYSDFTIATRVDDGVAPAVTGVKAMTGTAANDAPAPTNMNATEFYTEDIVLDLIDIVVSDVDSAEVNATLTLSNLVAGTLSTGTSGEVTSTWDGGSGQWSASGAIADVNALLAAVTFDPAVDFNESFTIATSVDDGLAPAVTGTKIITGTAVNDAPVAIDKALTLVEDTSATIVLDATDVDLDPLTFEVLSGPSHGSFGMSPADVVHEAPAACVTEIERGFCDMPVACQEPEASNCLTVDSLGTDDYTTIQDAIDAIPATIHSPYYVMVRGSDTPPARDYAGGSFEDVLRDPTDCPTDESCPIVVMTRCAPSGLRQLTRVNSPASCSASGISTRTGGFVVCDTPYVTIEGFEVALQACGTVRKGVGFYGTSQFGTARYVLANITDDLPGCASSYDSTAFDCRQAEDITFEYVATTDSPYNMSATTDTVRTEDCNRVSLLNSSICNTNSDDAVDFNGGDGHIVRATRVETAVDNAIEVDEASNVLIEDVLITGTHTGIRGYENGTQNLTIVEVEAWGNVSHGIKSEIPNTSVVMSYLHDNSSYGIDIYAQATGSTISHSLMEGNYRGLRMRANDFVEIDHNQFVDNLDDGLYLPSGAFVGQFDSNQFWGNGSLCNNLGYDACDAALNAPGNLFVSGPGSVFGSNFGRVHLYRPDADYVGADSFTFKANDGNLDSNVATVSITVTGVNDAPVPTNMNAGESYTEDVALDLIDIVVSDVDSATISATLTLSDVGAGSLSTGTSGGVTSTFVTGVWSASGALADVNSLLAGVTFDPTPEYNSNFTIATSVDDGDAPAVTGVKNMDATGVNDPPSPTNMNASENYTEDVALNLIDIVVSDFDSPNITASLTLSDVGAGSLNTATSGAVTSTFAGGVWSASGAIADVNTLLAGVTFTPTAEYADSFTIATSVDDGEAAAVTGNKSVTGNGVNDPPIPTNMNAAEIYTEDADLNLVNIVVSDIDSASVTATLTLSDLSAGSLSTGTSGGVTSTFAAGVWSASGAIADVNTLLAGVTYDPAADYDKNFTIGTSVDDGGPPVTGTKNMTGTGVNDAPVAYDQAVSLLEDTSATIVLDASDIDGDPLTYEIVSGPSNGALGGGPLDVVHEAPSACVTEIDRSACAMPVPCQEPEASNCLTVDSLGTDDYTTIQAAIDAIPATIHSPYYVMVRGTDVAPPRDYAGAYVEDIVRDPTDCPTDADCPVVVMTRCASGQRQLTRVNSPASCSADGVGTNDGGFIVCDSPYVTVEGFEVAIESCSAMRHAVGFYGNSDFGTARHIIGSVYDDPGGGCTASGGSDVFECDSAHDVTYDFVAVVETVQGGSASDALQTNDCDRVSILNSSICHGNTDDLIDLNNGDGILISATRVEDGPSYGIEIDQATDTTIDDVLLTGLVSGIYGEYCCADQKLTIIEVESWGNSNYGIYSNIPNTSVFMSYSHDNNYGVYLSSNAIDGTISQNLLDSNNRGIRVQPDDFVTIDHNQIANNGDDGMYLFSDSSFDGVFAANQFWGNGDNFNNVSYAASVAANTAPGNLFASGPGSVFGTGFGRVHLYRPNANYVGADSFTFKANDGLLDSNTATVSITVTAVNDAPTASAGLVSATEDTTFTFSPGDFNYSDIEGDSFSQIQVMTLETVGDLELSASAVVLDQVISWADIDAGNLKFVPAPDGSGSGYDSFDFKVHDGALFSIASYTMTVDVTGTNDPPVANAQGVSTGEGNALAITLTASDVDCCDALTYAIVANPSQGVLSGFNASTGAVTYTPTGTYTGADSFTFKANDGTVDGNTATVSITVTTVSCGSLSSPSNGSVSQPDTTYTGVATFSCNTGYNRSGAETRTCQANASWSGSSPTCVIVNCGSAPGIGNGWTTTPSGTEYGDPANYYCNTGYTRSGVTPRTCQSNGSWSGSTPVCNIVDCGGLSNPSNGSVSTPTGTQYLDWANYSCDPGHTRSGAASRQCQSNGSWSSSAPTCVPDLANCGAPGSPSNGSVSTPSGTDEGDSANYSCNGGYCLEGNSTRTCQADSSWSGSVPACNLGVTCQGLSGISNGGVNNPSTSCGSTATYWCATGYELVGNTSRTCLGGPPPTENQWSGSTPSCQRVDCGFTAPSPTNGYRTYSGQGSPNTRYNDHANFYCNGGYYGCGGPSSVVCQDDGTWAAGVLSCCPN